MPLKSQKQYRWPFDVRSLTPKLGAEIIGVDLARGVDDTLFHSIHRAFLQYQVLLFGTQDLPPGRQVDFARHFGEVQIHVMNQYHADGHPELYRLSNLDENGKKGRKGNQNHAINRNRWRDVANLLQIQFCPHSLCPLGTLWEKGWFSFANLCGLCVERV